MNSQMNFIFFCLALVVLASQVMGGILDCNYCATCNRLNPFCQAAQGPCVAAAGAFNTYTTAVWSYCAVRGNKDNMGEVEKAKDWLIRNKFFTRYQVRNVTFRWCSALKEFAGGMTPLRDQVLLNPNYYADEDYRGLVRVVGHELCHARQHVRWSDGILRVNGFACRYGHEILSGRGTGEKNAVEKECYDLGAKIKAAIDAERYRDENEGDTLEDSNSANPVIIGAVIAGAVLVCIALITIAVMIKVRRRSSASDEDVVASIDTFSAPRFSRGSRVTGSRITGSRIGPRGSSRMMARRGTKETHSYRNARRSSYIY